NWERAVKSFSFADCRRVTYLSASKVTLSHFSESGGFLRITFPSFFSIPAFTKSRRILIMKYSAAASSKSFSERLERSTNQVTLNLDPSGRLGCVETCSHLTVLAATSAVVTLWPV